jgi:hypothetical protein
METNEILDQHYDHSQILLTDTAIGFLKESAKWANFLAILGFIGVGFMVLAGLGMGAFLSMDAGMGDVSFISPVLIAVIYLVMGILYFFPVLYLYRFGRNTQEAIQRNDTASMTTALQNLKSMFRFSGIMAIVLIALYIVAIIAGGIGGFMSI